MIEGLVAAIALFLCMLVGMGIASSALKGREKSKYAPSIFFMFAAYKFFIVIALAAFRPEVNDLLIVGLLGGIAGMMLYASKCIFAGDWERLKARFVAKEAINERGH